MAQFKKCSVPIYVCKEATLLGELYGDMVKGKAVGTNVEAILLVSVGAVKWSVPLQLKNSLPYVGQLFLGCIYPH